jgi:preprotein translocase subunit SecG
MSVNLMIIVYVLIVVAMIAFILVQKSSGATAGSAFGSGASSTVFGAKGSGNFLTKTTMLLAFLFFALSMMMAVEAKKQFSASTTGEIDLGVIGTLDTNSDVPDITSLDPVKDSQESDLPVIENTMDNASDSVENAADDVTDGVNQLEEAATEVINNTSDKVDEIKEAVEEKAEDVKEAVEEEIDPDKE